MIMEGLVCGRGRERETESRGGGGVERLGGSSSSMVVCHGEGGNRRELGRRRLGKRA